MYVRANTRLVVTAIYGTFNFDEDIHILELRTVCWALLNVIRRSPPRTKFVALCDNTIAVALLKRMRGSCWKSHLAILPLAEALYEMQSELDVDWVSTHVMLADKLTRLKTTRMAHSEGMAIHDLVQRQSLSAGPIVRYLSEHLDGSSLDGNN